MALLLTGAGPRSYLVRYFREALDPGCQVICADCRASAPAGNEADHFYPVSDSGSPSSLREIAAICRKHRVRALFSGQDLDAHVLSHHQEAWASAGVQAFLPSPQWSSIALDNRSFDRA
jgi:carbamoyl-phosphate synthase large subunit